MNRLFRLAGTLALTLAVLLPAATPQAKIPDGWPFLDFNEAVKVARQSGKPMFVYFGFETCPYCLYLNQHALASESLRKLYTTNYVLGYFDVRGDREDAITLPDGRTMTRAEVLKGLKVSSVPTWMFVSAEGRAVLMRGGSRTRVNEFWKYDLYVAGGGYRQGSFEEFLAKRGLREERPE
jgi:thioredoxin-related protein